MDVKPVIMKKLKICGLFIQLTTSQSQNHQIISKQWQNFNKILKSKRLKLGRNWVKYGITKKIGNNYYYMTAIPSEIEIDGFDTETINAGEYYCFQHIGAMELIKLTIYKIYKEVIPLSNIRLSESRMLIHYERYDYRFNWNKPNSIIDIYIPIS